MNKETLEKANELQNKIYILDQAIDYLNDKYEIALCWWKDGKWSVSEYKKLIALTGEEINWWNIYFKNKKEQLEKELEEL